MKKRKMDIKLKLFLLFCVIDNSNATNLKNRNLYNNQKESSYLKILIHSSRLVIQMIAEVLNFYGFEPHNYRNRVDQLKNSGLKELEAQTLADQEVASGKYLNWNFNA